VRLLSVARELPTLGFALLLGNFAISTGNLLFSKRLFEAVGGFDESLAIIHDWQFLLQSTRFVEPTLIPRFLYRYRIHGSNTYRVNPEPTGSDVVRMHQSFFAWASQQANNPLAPIPQHFPRFYPFFLPIWLRFVSQRGGNVPRLLARLAGSLRDSPSARSAAIERTAVARTYALLKAPRKEADVTQFAALLEECASRWNAIAGTYPRAEPRLGRPVEAAARFEWAGASVTVTTSDPVLLHDLADFTGLVAIPDQIPLGRAGLNALGTHDVYVHDQHRRYPCPEDRLIWLALTVGEFLARDGAALLLHAASIRFDSGAVLLMGEPLTGKSTLAFEALSCGLGVLGDDQVRLQAATSRVQALPRPVKLRVPIDAPLPAGIPSGRKPLRGHLENEPTLMLRRAGLCVSPDGWHSTSLVVHLSRRRDCQCAIERIEDPELMREFLTAQLRGALADHPDPFETVARGLLGIPHYRLSVGVGKAAEALALIAATLRDRLGT